ncbi:hypothetical protein L484_028090 [Morus notabilis]|uniref:Uncharacterized protein n=1 Tax=Morus notabilis TaxID=981085 RepID=W9S7X6_9ROSA|nr:hypothetical protein L484_028090 [Morus notabilis]
MMNYMKKPSSIGCVTKTALEDSAVSVKRLKKETKELKENSCVLPKKSISSSTDVVVIVLDGGNGRRTYGVVADHDQATFSPAARARRIEALKRRFAGTMSRAKQKMEECKRYNDCIRRGERETQSTESLMIAEQRRESFRIALVEMEKNADHKITQNIDSMKELEKLCGCGDYSTKILLGIPLKTLLDLRLKPDDAF